MEPYFAEYAFLQIKVDAFEFVLFQHSFSGFVMLFGVLSKYENIVCNTGHSLSINLNLVWKACYNSSVSEFMPKLSCSKHFMEIFD